MSTFALIYHSKIAFFAASYILAAGKNSITIIDNFLENLPALDDDIRAIKDIIITNIVLIGQTPAPTFKEKKRSTIFMERLAEFGVDEVTTDGYRNPIGIIRGTSPDKPPIFVMAHLDTFYERVLAIRERAASEPVDALLEELGALEKEAFGLLIAERLAADESFRIFTELLGQVRSELR